MFPSLICRSAPLVKSISMILISPVAAAWCKAVRPRESFKETKVVPHINFKSSQFRSQVHEENSRSLRRVLCCKQEGKVRKNAENGRIQNWIESFFEHGRARTKGLATQRKRWQFNENKLVIKPKGYPQQHWLILKWNFTKSSTKLHVESKKICSTEETSDAGAPKNMSRLTRWEHADWNMDLSVRIHSLSKINHQYLEDHPRTPKWVNNHGDRKSPKDRVIPLPNGLNGL